MSDTPRTDAQMTGGMFGAVLVKIEFARELERELSAELDAKMIALTQCADLMEERDQLRTTVHNQADRCIRLERELSEQFKEMVEIKCELALSTKTDDEKPIETIRRMSSALGEARSDYAKALVHLQEKDVMWFDQCAEVDQLRAQLAGHEQVQAAMCDRINELKEQLKDTERCVNLLRTACDDRCTCGLGYTCVYHKALQAYDAKKNTLAA